MIWTLAVIAILQGVQITPPERRFFNRDLCEVARGETVADLQAHNALVLSSRCNLQEMRN